MTKVHKFGPLILVILFWLVDLISKLKYNGLIYGFDYGLYHPDGSLYTFRTLNLMGHSQLDSGQMVSDWYANHAYKMKEIDPSSLFYDINSQWDRYLPRILYPLLSIPFVSIFGISGMLFIPALSMLVLMLTIYFVAVKLERKWLGVSLAIALSLSLTVNRWMFINTTDSLLTGLTALIIPFLLTKKTNRMWWLGILSLILLTSLTRVSFFIWIPIALVLFFNGRRRDSLIIFISSLLDFLPSIYRNTSSAILPNESSNSAVEKLLAFPKSLIRVAYYEIAELAVLDRLLLILLAITFVLAIKNFGRLSSQYFLCVLAGLWFTGAVNGTPGVNFRYQLPVLAFLVWGLLDNLRVKALH